MTSPYDDTSADISEHTPKGSLSSTDTSSTENAHLPSEKSTEQHLTTTVSSSPQRDIHKPVNVSFQIPSLKTGLKLKNHVSILSSHTLYMFGGQNQLTKEIPNQMMLLKLKSGYLKSINVTHPNMVPFRGACMMTIPAVLNDDDELDESGSIVHNTTSDTTTAQEQRIITFGGVNEEQVEVQGYNSLSLANFQWKTDVRMNGTWEVPSYRLGASCVTIAPCHYLYGGEDMESLLNGMWKYDTTNEMFSYIHPRSDPNVEGARVPPPSYYHASCAWKDEVLVFGGFINQSTCSLQIYRFNIKTQRWGKPIQVPENLYPDGVCHHQMVTIGDYLVIVGGTKFVQYDDMDEGSEPESLGESVNICNLAKQQWVTQLNTEGTLGARVGHTLHAHKDQVWVIGGDVDNIADQDIVVLQSDILSQQAEVPSTNLQLETVTIAGNEERKAFPPPKSPFDSVIISYKDGITLNKWFGDRKQQWRLLYRGTRDGFNSSTWHNKVDNQGPTMSIVLANGYIFGGYTPIAWKSSGADQYDDQTWIFSLKNPNDDLQYKFPKIPQSVKKQRSVYHASGYGLWLGSNDILIYSGADANTSSNANLGKAFEYNLTFDTATFFCGQSGFKVTELETFALA
mmetsp:Transcript_5250/g.19656  ORF Transcript_5250/g.19656 Transcript_5250/m.19656 type:complete len:625 (-) Transcript_5250:261-2135(-)|eukprot:CAMPEP_0117443484 /NCGR_PEP_ID=MMETSP0759-20121206/4717_1 /TAXON_ID=63605 /ORGANISM="Percolomonas cosmopolitus, Strain WS" /LENGTH=624 /DNA_ID=CAMNT_0005235457 /DNA_START=172 /DNA_END=2046 /DNA_ORIENTATION=-